MKSNIKANILILIWILPVILIDFILSSIFVDISPRNIQMISSAPAAIYLLISLNIFLLYKKRESTKVTNKLLVIVFLLSVLISIYLCYDLPDFIEASRQR